MRDAIKARLSGQITDIAGRCYDVNEPDATTVKPFLVVSQRDETSDRTATAFRRKYRIHVYADPSGSFADVDALANGVLGALHNVVLTDGVGKTGTCVYEGSRWEDRVDPDLGAATRSLDFWLNGLERPDATVPDAADPWLDAMTEWTGTQLDSEWRVYRDVWPSDAVMPCVLWRICDVRSAPVHRSAWQMRKTLAGHVAGRTVKERQQTVNALADMLGRTIRIPLDAASGTFLSLALTRSDTEADAWTAGQLRVALTRVVEAATAQEPVISQVHVTEQIDGSVTG